MFQDRGESRKLEKGKQETIRREGRGEGGEEGEGARVALKSTIHATL